MNKHLGFVQSLFFISNDYFLLGFFLISLKGRIATRVQSTSLKHSVHDGHKFPLPSHCTQRYPLPKYPERNNIRKLSDASV
jgi:hypothetical protein